MQVHAPLEVPAALLSNFSFISNTNRAHYAALANSLDTLVGNVVDALVARGMWEDTLLVFSSDNGGPVYISPDTDSVLDGSGNNWPLRGGKVCGCQGFSSVLFRRDLLQFVASRCRTGRVVYVSTHSHLVVLSRQHAVEPLRRVWPASKTGMYLCSVATPFGIAYTFIRPLRPGTRRFARLLVLTPQTQRRRLLGYPLSTLSTCGPSSAVQI